MTATQIQKNAKLRNQLASLITANTTLKLSQDESVVDVIVTHVEVNDKHGVGCLIQRIFSNSSNIFSIRSRNLYEKKQVFGKFNICLAHTELSRPEAFMNVFSGLSKYRVKRVLCVPYFPDDVLTAIAIKELFNVPLCTYIMDDQNIYTKGISDELISELLTKSSLRLAISPEIRDTYEKKYGLKFWVLPVVVPEKFLQSNPVVPSGELINSKTGVLIGNLWSQKWLTLLRDTIKNSGVHLHWYGNNGHQWLNLQKSELATDGINDCGFLEKEEQLVERLRSYPYAVVPSSTLDERDTRHEIGRLSLPSRIPFILATSNTPMIVLGSRETAAAHFVERFQIGVVSDYNSSSFRQAVEYITDPDIQRSMRHNAAAIADYFTAEGIAEWIWESLEQGTPCEFKFETLMSPKLVTTFLKKEIG